MNKAALMETFLKELQAGARRQQGANKRAAEGATDSESRAETKWDTGGLEASYLARGYARQFAQMAGLLETLRDFHPPSFEGKPIGNGALVCCDLDGEASWVFILGGAGGWELTHEGEQITVVSPESPLGSALMGKKSSQQFLLPNGITGQVLQVW